MSNEPRQDSILKQEHINQETIFHLLGRLEAICHSTLEAVRENRLEVSTMKGEIASLQQSRAGLSGWIAGVAASASMVGAGLALFLSKSGIFP